MPPEEKKKKTTPSHFGSHSSMIDKEKTEALTNKDMVVLEDEFGFYETEIKRLDSGLADPNRYCASRITQLFAGHKEEAKAS